MVIDFLRTFSALTRAEQRVFIYCLEKCPFPRPYTGDLERIANGTDLSRMTVYKALLNISATPQLHHLVCYIRTDINQLIRDEYHNFSAGGDFINGGDYAT